MIKLAVVTVVASLLFFTGCSGASSSEVADPTDPSATGAPSTPAASLVPGAGGVAGGAAAKNGAVPAAPGATPAATPGMPAPAAAPVAGCQMEVEPNDTRAGAQVIALVAGTSATACGALAKPTDEDWFVVHVTGADADVAVALTTLGDVTVEMFSPTGDVYAESHVAGTKDLEVASIDAWDGAGDYVLHVKSATHAVVSYSLALIVEQ